jgi:hypothetical protein
VPVGLAATRRRADAALLVGALVGALLVAGAFVVDVAPAAGTTRHRQAPGQDSGQVPPAVAAAQRELERATDALEAWEAANGADPAARVADLDAQLAALEARRAEPAGVDERAEIEFAFAALTATRADAVADQADHDLLLAAQDAAREAVVAAKRAAPGPEWAPPSTEATAVSSVEAEAPVRDDTWVVMALAAGFVVLAALAVVAVRHRRWRARVFALEGTGGGRRRARPPVALEERVDVPIERPRRSRSRSRHRGLP